MNLADDAYAMTIALLRVPESGFEQACEALRKHGKKNGFEYEKMLAPGRRAVGMASDAGASKPLVEWARELRSRDPALSVRVGEIPPEDRADFPARVAAGFQGTFTRLLEISSGGQARCYGLRFAASRRYRITGPEFAEFLDEISPDGKARGMIASDVNLQNDVRRQARVSAADLGAFFGTAEGAGMLELLAPIFLQRLQNLMKATAGALPPIPERFAPLIKLAPSPFGAGGWSFAENPERQEFYLFTELSGAKLGPAIDFARAREAFVRSLTEIEAYAARIGSPFAEAFLLARRVLESGAEPKAADGLSATAVKVLACELELGDELAALGLPADRVRALVAAGIADVFGGMGSWNDEARSGEAEYKRVSDQLFGDLRRFWLAALTFHAS